MKNKLSLVFLLLTFCVLTNVSKGEVKVEPGNSVITWSGWNNYQNTNVFYRIQVINPTDLHSQTVAIEILNDSQKDVSFNIAINDDGLKSTFQAVKVKRKQSTIINYPKPKDVVQMFASINNMEIN